MEIKEKFTYLFNTFLSLPFQGLKVIYIKTFQTLKSVRTHAHTHTYNMTVIILLVMQCHTKQDVLSCWWKTTVEGDR